MRGRQMHTHAVQDVTAFVQGGRPKGGDAFPGSGGQGRRTAPESYIVPHAQELTRPRAWHAAGIIRCWLWVGRGQTMRDEGWLVGCLDSGGKQTVG